MKAKILLFGLFLFAFTLSTQAQIAAPVVKDRQINQQERINKGVQSGTLTKGETVRLQKQQARVQRAKKCAKADGVVTKRERARIHKKQNKASKNICRAKKNKRNRS